MKRLPSWDGVIEPTVVGVRWNGAAETNWQLEGDYIRFDWNRQLYRSEVTHYVITAEVLDTGTSDFNGDGSVNFSDFIAFAQKYGTAKGDEGFDAKYDLDGKGSVDFADFIQFAKAYGT